MSCSSLLTTHPANSNLPSITQNALEQRCLFYDSGLTEDQKILQEIQKACQKAEKKRFCQF